MADDIDGDLRPEAGGGGAAGNVVSLADIGPDEFTGTPSTPENCFIPEGACCTEGVCSDGVTQEADCEAGGGTYQGNGTTCDSIVCTGLLEFRRGDHDGSGLADITDALNLLGFLFLGNTPPICMDASDFDNSGMLDITDALILLGHLFLGQPNAIPPPGTTNCGLDPDTISPAIPPLPEQSPITLGCDKYPGEDFPAATCP